MNIHDLSPGDRVRLADYGKTTADYRRRLMILGVRCGVEVKIIRFAPLGCPVEILVNGLLLAIRKNEAADLIWEFA